MSDAGTGSVETEIRIEAPPEEVFPYLTDPARVIRWMGVECKLDAAPGGSFRIDMNGNDVAAGHFVVIDPPRRVVLTWGWEGSSEMPPGSTTVEFLLTADGESTLVHLTHRELPPSQAPSHLDGWGYFLPRLALAATGQDPGPQHVHGTG